MITVLASIVFAKISVISDNRYNASAYKAEESCFPEMATEEAPLAWTFHNPWRCGIQAASDQGKIFSTASYFVIYTYLLFYRLLFDRGRGTRGRSIRYDGFRYIYRKKYKQLSIFLDKPVGSSVEVESLTNPDLLKQMTTIMSQSQT